MKSDFVLLFLRVYASFLQLQGPNNYAKALRKTVNIEDILAAH